jgi:hypothetical protein
MVEVPVGDAALEAFCEGWSATQTGNPRAALGV